MRLKNYARDGCGGFTRIEAVAFVAMVFLLLFLVIPSAAHGRSRTKSAICLSNFRHLIGAWQMYASENDGLLVGNRDATRLDVTPNPPLPWVAGFMDWQSRPDNTNMLKLRDPYYAAFAPYLTPPQNVHKCPADTYQSSFQRWRGWHRVRSISMNTTVGEDTDFVGNPIYRIARKLSDLTLPSPAETMVILEEHPVYLGDSVFVPPTSARWWDLPGNLHNGAAAFNFADGHAELHPWRTEAVREYPVRFTFSQPPNPSISKPDISWLNYHSQRSREESN